MHEIVKYNRIIKEVGKCDEGKGMHVDKKKCVLLVFMILHITYADTILSTSPVLLR